MDIDMAEMLNNIIPQNLACIFNIVNNYFLNSCFLNDLHQNSKFINSFCFIMKHNWIMRPIWCSKSIVWYKLPPIRNNPFITTSCSNCWQSNSFRSIQNYSQIDTVWLRTKFTNIIGLIIIKISLLIVVCGRCNYNQR